jgi:hypothetical protein
MKASNFIFIFFLFSIHNLSAQENISKTLKISDMITKVFEKTQFEGVQIMKIKRKSYVVCSVILPYESSSDMALIAQQTAERNLLAFLNNDQISSTTTIELIETATGEISSENGSSKDVEYTKKTIDKIKRNTSGFIKGVQCIYVKEDEIKKRKIYLFYCPLKKTN